MQALHLGDLKRADVAQNEPAPGERQALGRRLFSGQGVGHILPGAQNR